MRIDGVSRETEPHLFVYINRCYSHFLVIPLMFLTGNDHDQMTADTQTSKFAYFQRIFQYKFAYFRIFHGNKFAYFQYHSYLCTA